MKRQRERKDVFFKKRKEGKRKKEKGERWREREEEAGVPELWACYGARSVCRRQQRSSV